jgi:hypothetical protein
MTTKPIEAVAITKLSQAIREGAKLRPQTTLAYFYRCDDGELGSCALGAAAEALGLNLSSEGIGMQTDSILSKRFGGLLDKPTQHPLFPHVVLRLEKVITDLNDVQGWSREQIADWLEGLGY